MKNEFSATLDWTFSLFGITFQFYFDTMGYPKGTFNKGQGIHGVHLKWFYFGFCTSRVFKKRIEDLIVDAMLKASQRGHEMAQPERRPESPSHGPAISLNKDNLH
jgi:hypothetical protein